jgi:D-alanine-D-alanine ligase
VKRTRPRKLRVLLLTHRELYARESIAGRSEREVVSWRTEYHVMRGLRALGHEVEQLGLDTSLAPLHAVLDRFAPHVVFNLLIELRDSGGFEPHVVARSRRAACRTRAATPRRSCSHATRRSRRSCSRGTACRSPCSRRSGAGGASARRAGSRFPLIVKPIDEGGSYGIRGASVVHGAAALTRRVEWVHRHCGHDAIAEQYIEGREITIGLLGNRRPRCSPLWETRFERLPAGAPRIVTERIKWNLAHRRASAGALGSRRADCPPARGARSSASRCARGACCGSRALRGSTSASTPQGTPWLIDVNANPDVDFRRGLRALGRARGHLADRDCSCSSSSSGCATARTGSTDRARRDPRHKIHGSSGVTLLVSGDTGGR